MRVRLKQQKLAQQRVIEGEVERRKQAPGSPQPKRQAPSRPANTERQQQHSNPPPQQQHPTPTAHSPHDEAPPQFSTAQQVSYWPVKYMHTCMYVCIVPVKANETI